MPELSSFASDLLEEAKWFFQKATETAEPDFKSARLHAALMLSCAAFEAHVNAIADDFLAREDLSPHERGLLAEHIVELKNGDFQEKTTLKMHRLEDRVLFLCQRFSKKPIDRKASYWSQFIDALRLRNRLTHPKTEPPRIGENAVRRALKAIIELLNAIYISIYKRKLPAYNRGLSSKLHV